MRTRAHANRILESSLSFFVFAFTYSLAALARAGAPSRIVEAKRTGVVLAFDVAGLVELTLRLAYRTPDWEDFVSLAVTEIRQLGRDSIQIARRMRAMLENLIAVVPPQRAAALRAELETPSPCVERGFQDAEDRARAASGDSLGVGGSS